MKKTIGVLGSGLVGQTLADGFLRHGHDVMRGSRDPPLTDIATEVVTRLRP
jgi:predicted dinucleotide-binding enzyme